MPTLPLGRVFLRRFKQPSQAMWQFSLRTMLIALTAMAVWLGLLVTYPCFAAILLIIVFMFLFSPSPGEFTER